MAFCVLAVGACGAPDEEAKPRPLPEELRELGPGTYRTEEFEPAFSFRVGEGWSVEAPEAYDVLRITQGHEDGGLGFVNLEGARFFKPTNTGTMYMTDVPKDVVGWFREHPYLETQGTDPVKVGGSKACGSTWSWGTCRKATTAIGAARGACPSSGSAAVILSYFGRKTRPA